jgi:CheY-like chemotaxis protein
VAEDDELDVFFLRHAIAKAGILNPLVIFSDGRGVVRYLAGEPPYQSRTLFPLPAAIFLDLKMPRMTGFDVLSWIQSHPEFSHIPSVILSSSDESSDRDKAFSLGASDFRVKPGSATDLVEILLQLKARWFPAETPES